MHRVRRSSRRKIAKSANEQNNVTEKAKLPAFTAKPPGVPLTQWYKAATSHAKPIPKNTLTAFDPVTFPIELSAYLSCTAATLLANVS